jgi:Circularly permutated YpsA SLOG family
MAISKQLCILSGGQTGADRAALDFAIRHGLEHGGWCPRRRRAEDGPLADSYQLQETPSVKYDQRTRWNVRDSDATLLVTIGCELSGGTSLTAQVAQRLGKPWLHISRETTTDLREAGAQVREFLLQHNVLRLNVAGPRASQEPEVGSFVEGLLAVALDDESPA